MSSSRLMQFAPSRKAGQTMEQASEPLHAVMIDLRWLSHGIAPVVVIIGVYIRSALKLTIDATSNVCSMVAAVTDIGKGHHA